jgi:hypothetical protein
VRVKEEVCMTRLSSEIEEKLPGLFEPNTILPVQYFTRLQRGSAWTGEQRLMAAILEDAVAVCAKPTAPRASKARHVLRETVRWLRSNDRTWMFSFLRICEMLDLDPGAIRRGIRIIRGEEATPTRPATVATADVFSIAPAEFEPPQRAATG